MKTILLVEDQALFQTMVVSILEDGQHSVQVAPDTVVASQLMQQQKFDLVLLDISLPDKNGLDFYAEIQSAPESQKIPVIFLTGAESLTSKVAAFSLGAEDYITKPFNPIEFKVRVHSKIRKSSSLPTSGDEFKSGPFHFKIGSQRVFDRITHREIELSPKEFRLLYYFARHEDAVVSRDQLLLEVWGPNTHVSDRAVDSHIYLLRKKLGDFATCIEAVPGVGYRFCASPTQEKNAA